MSKLALAKPTDMGGLERVLIEGDLKGLTPQQRETYYLRVCESVGLNPLTQPFEYLSFQNKTVLYARRACTDQLRQIHSVSVAIVSRETVMGVHVVTARATLPDGRCDESTGAVSIENQKGENLSNALMKAETKAKRRVTLSICGLSMLDETELEGLPKEQPRKAARTLDDVAYDKETGEVRDNGRPLASAASHSTTMQASTTGSGAKGLTSEQETDEYGLPVPQYPCPVVARDAKQNAGKLWSQLQGPLIDKMYAEAKDRMSTPQREWCEYLIMKRAARKAAEAAATKAATPEDEQARAEAAEAERAERALAEMDAAKQR